MSGRDPSGQALAVPVEPASSLAASRFDPSRGEITYDERLQYEERILAAEMECERLKRALKPFATKCILWNGENRNWMADSTQVQHRLGDFREAWRLIFGGGS